MGCESPQALTNVSHSSASGSRLKALCVLPCYLETADWMSDDIMNALQNKNLPDDRAVGGADLILDDESAQGMYCLEPLCMLSGFRPAKIEKQPLNFHLAKSNRNRFNPLPQRQSSASGLEIAANTPWRSCLPVLPMRPFSFFLAVPTETN